MLTAADPRPARCCSRPGRRPSSSASVAGRASARPPRPRLGLVVPAHVGGHGHHRVAGGRRAHGDRCRPPRSRRGRQAPRPRGLPRHDRAAGRRPPGRRAGGRRRILARSPHAAGAGLRSRPASAASCWQGWATRCSSAIRPSPDASSPASAAKAPTTTSRRRPSGTTPSSRATTPSRWPPCCNARRGDLRVRPRRGDRAGAGGAGRQGLRRAGRSPRGRAARARLVKLRNTDHFATPESFAFIDAMLGFLDAVPA